MKSIRKEGIAMETEFSKALQSDFRNGIIPEDMDWFGSLVGEWDIIWKENYGKENETVYKGEWIFQRILNGCGIQDLFIVPSREERKHLNLPNAEYGTTIRMYRPDEKCWEIYYTCIGEYTRLQARKENEKIVLTELSRNKMKWIFSDITHNSFHWENVMINDNGEWEVMCDCQANRRV